MSHSVIRHMRDRRPCASSFSCLHRACLQPRHHRLRQAHRARLFHQAHLLQHRQAASCLDRARLQRLPDLQRLGASWGQHMRLGQTTAVRAGARHRDPAVVAVDMASGHRAVDRAVVVDHRERATDYILDYGPGRSLDYGLGCNLDYCSRVVVVEELRTPDFVVDMGYGSAVAHRRTDPTRSVLDRIAGVADLGCIRLGCSSGHLAGHLAGRSSRCWPFL